MRLVPINMFKPSSDFLVTVPRGALFVDPLCYLCFKFIFVMLSCLFLAITYWERADLFALLCVVFCCDLSLWCSGSGMVLDCIGT